MGKTMHACLACLALIASGVMTSGAAAGGPPPPGFGDVTVAAMQSPVGPSGPVRYRCRWLDRYGHVHYRWCSSPVAGGAVTEPPAPIPSPHYYWRG
jgi:hypothetical protein